MAIHRVCVNSASDNGLLNSRKSWSQHKMSEVPGTLFQFYWLWNSEQVNCYCGFFSSIAKPIHPSSLRVWLSMTFFPDNEHVGERNSSGRITCTLFRNHWLSYGFCGLLLPGRGLCPIYGLSVQYEVAAIDPSAVDFLPVVINLVVEIKLAEPVMRPVFP